MKMETEMHENFTFEERFTLLDRLMQIPMSVCIIAIIYGWGFWLGVITG